MIDEEVTIKTVYFKNNILILAASNLKYEDRYFDQEERILKQMNMPKNKINELREFDWAQFNDERRFTRKQNITNDQYFALIPVNDKKEFKNINDILDSIEDEALYEYLKDEEPVLLTVILLKIQGFSIKEISKVINIPISTIYRKIEKIKRNFR